MKRLRFLTPIQHEGPSITVRRGVKWALCEAGEDVLIEGQAPTETREGEILSVAVFPFSRITEAMIRDEHDPNRRIVNGLFAAMARAYPGFHEDEIVTIVRYQIY